MISFGIMTALLVAMASVVHFDLLGLFPAHPNGKHTADNEHQHRPTYDQMWIPRPGTDPSTFYLLPRTIIVDDDGDDFWTDADDSASNGTQNNRNTADGLRSDDEDRRQLLSSAQDTIDRVPATTSTAVPDDDRDYDDDDDDEEDYDYVAPGQEKDDDVF